MLSRRSILALAAAAGLFTGAPGLARAQYSAPYKLIDLASSWEGAVFPGSNPDRYVEYQGAVYFFASGDWGSGLWRTDGTRSGTTFVESFGSIADMAVANGLLFISGESDITYGIELYKYDGFSATLVKDIRPGGVDSNPGRFFVWTDRLMFSADPDGLGQVLHTSDGTTAGTVALDTYKDPQEFVSFNARVFFTAKVNQLPATETNLWSWSALTGGELVESRVVGNLAVLGTTLYVTKRSGSTTAGRQEGELWKTDGTPGAAIKVSNLWTGGDAAVSEKTVFGTDVFFAGCDPASGRNLYKTDGTTVTLVKDFLLPDDLQPGVPAPPANSCDPANGPQQLTVINGKLYFEADDGDRGHELWASDGTTPGTVLLEDIDFGAEASDLHINSTACGRAACRAVIPGGFFFTARTEYTGRELYFCDGTSAYRVTDLDSGDRDGVPTSRILLSGGKVFFAGSDEDANAEPWVLPLDPTLAVADVTVSESAGLATVTVRLLPANPGATVTVNWTTVSGWASPGSDYTTSSGVLTFTPGDDSETLTVPILEDATLEGDEYFSIVLSSPVNAAIGNSTSRVTIRDNEGPFLSVSGPLSDPVEGASATFTVTLTAPHDNIVTVHYRTVAVTASRSDFTSKVSDYSNYLVFDPTTSETPQTKTVSIATTADTIYEYWWEYFELEIFAASGASITTSRAWASILDNDAEPTANIVNRTVTEDVAFATFTVNLTRASAQTTRLYWSTDGGGAAPAAPGPDFRDASGFVVFPPGQTSHDVTVELFEDTIDEPNETYYVDLDTSTAVGTTVGVGRGVGTITDDDTGTLRIGNVTVVEGDAGPVDAVLDLTLSTPYYQDFTVNYATEDGTATEVGGDYVPSSGAISFPAGTTSQTVTVQALGDLVDEVNEIFRVRLSASTGPGITDSVGDVTVTDDDTTVSVADASASEPASGTSTITVTVTTPEAYKAEFSVDYATVAGGAQPATPGVDYVATNGTLVFPLGIKSRTFTVTVNHDVIDEPAETFLIQLSNSSGPTILDGEAIGTINDNDIASVAINNVTAPEGNSGTTDAVFTVSINTPYYRDFTVNWATAVGTGANPATEGVDYLGDSGTLTFLAGTTSQTVAVSVVGDTLDEPNETFAVVLSNSTGPTISDSRGDGTITDDDALTIDAADVEVVEGNSGTTLATFTVSVNADHAGTITVNVATSGGGPSPPAATAGTDFVTLPSTLVTFAPGVLSQQVSVSVIGDTTVEANNESFGLTLSNPTGGATLARTKAYGIILDDDSDRTISMSPLSVAVTEPLSGTVNATFTATLSADAGRTITVDYATANGTATAGSDYTATSGTLSFEPGERTKTIDVTVLADALVEASETFTLTLSAPTNGTIAAGAGTATATIGDSLSQVPLSFYTVDPCRLVDTRSPAPGSPLVAGTPQTFQVTGSCNIPVTARAISYNVTVAGATASGNVRLFPGGTPAPSTSAVNFKAGQVRANNGMVALGTNGDVGAVLSPGGTVHVIIDVNGYME